MPSHSSVLSPGTEIHPGDGQESGQGMGPKLGPLKECRLVAEGSSRQNPGAADNQANRPVPCPLSWWHILRGWVGHSRTHQTELTCTSASCAHHEHLQLHTNNRDNSWLCLQKGTKIANSYLEQVHGGQSEDIHKSRQRREESISLLFRRAAWLGFLLD